MKKRILSAAILTVITVSGCASSTAPKMNVPDAEQVRASSKGWGEDLSLASLQSLKGVSAEEAVNLRVETGDGSRYQALKDSAYNLGIQSGLYKRRLKLNKMLQTAQPQLGRIFDFSPWILPGNVFPPVITETQGMLQKNGRKEIRGVRHSYHILTMPQVLIEPPTYLNYLVRHYPAPSRPDPLRLPNGDIEEKNWSLWVQEGWEIGIQQADLQYQADVNRLKRDLKGIRLFHDLVAKNVISMPRIARQDFGVVKSQDGRTLNIGDEVLSIVTDSSFKDSEAWIPVTGERLGE